jgi:hypothetical protein
VEELNSLLDKIFAKLKLQFPETPWSEFTEQVEVLVCALGISSISLLCVLYELAGKLTNGAFHF